MFRDHLEKFKLPVFVSSVLEDSLDRYNFVCVEVGARVDDTKGTVRDHFVKSVLLPSLLLQNQLYNSKYGVLIERNLGQMSRQ